VANIREIDYGNLDVVERTGFQQLKGELGTSKSKISKILTELSI
jgi:hypothetical protein